MSSRIQHALESCYGGLYAAYNGIVSAMASPSLHDSSEDALIDLLSENHLEKNEENQIDLDQLNRINEMFRSNAKVGEGGRSLDEIRGLMDRSFMWYRQDCTDHYLFYLAYKEVGDPCEGYETIPLIS